jgi:hypothetical protein
MNATSALALLAVSDTQLLWGVAIGVVALWVLFRVTKLVVKLVLKLVLVLMVVAAVFWAIWMVGG